MVITEIFPKPTVKQVAFELRYPNLFYLENKIGDFQIKIMKEYPTSSLLFRRHLLLADLGPKAKLKPVDEEATKKVWEFKSENKITLNITTNSLSMVSEHHKTYNLEGADKFRDAIEFVLNSFIEVMAIPLLKRIGLRYIDECPLPTKDNDTFTAYYNSVFQVDRFDIADAKEMQFMTVCKRGEHNIRYIETLFKDNDDKYKYILDFDGFANNIQAENCLTVTDELHRIISAEYERTIKEPVYEYMRQRGEANE